MAEVVNDYQVLGVRENGRYKVPDPKNLWPG